MATETAESLLAKTHFVVEATSCEQFFLWQQHAIESDKRIASRPRRWEQTYHGWIVTVGHLNRRPVCVSMCWCLIDGRRVLFWYPTSEVVDHVQIEKWFSKHFARKWDSESRRACCDAMNFHHCLEAIDKEPL